MSDDSPVDLIDAMRTIQDNIQFDVLALQQPGAGVVDLSKELAKAIGYIHNIALAVEDALERLDRLDHS